MTKPVWLAIVLLFFAWMPPAGAYPHGGVSGGVIPTADVKCNLATGLASNSTTCSSPAATCDGNAAHDDAPAFVRFHTWALGYQGANPGNLIELDTPAGTCMFITDAGTFTSGLKRFQLVGYGTTFSDNNAGGGGFLFGQDPIANGPQPRFATITAGATSITLLDKATWCSSFHAGDWTVLTGLDPQAGPQRPANPQFFEYVQVNSVASCAGTGVVTLMAPTRYAYKSTWPSTYYDGGGGQVDDGGPATVYVIDQNWVIDQAFYGLIFNIQTANITAAGKTMAFYDIASVHTSFCVVPTTNQNWSITNMSSCDFIELDKLIENATMTNVNVHFLLVQTGNSPQNFTCNNCNLDIGGSTGISVFNGGVLGSIAGSFTIGNTAFGGPTSTTINNATFLGTISLGGPSLDNPDHIGVWASGTLTVPPNFSATFAANNGSGEIRLTVDTSVGLIDGVYDGGPQGGPCAGNFPVHVIDGTHIDLVGSTYTADCGHQPFGWLPLNWAVPGKFVYFPASDGGQGPMLEIADMSVGANNETVVSFNLNGSPYAGGFPTMPGVGGAGVKIHVHPAPSWACNNCTGPMNLMDVSGAGAAGKPFGAYVSRTVTALNNTESAATAMLSMGLMTETDITVNAACGGASNFNLGGPFVQTLGTVTNNRWGPTVDATIASATARKIFPTTTSGAQSGDSLATPGADAWILNAQTVPLYSAVSNCGSASTTITIQTDQQGVAP